MTSAASIFVSHARSKVVVFECAIDCSLGAYALRDGDGIKAVEEQSTGLWNLYVSWADGSIGRVPAATVNKLAAEKIVEDASNFHFAGDAK